MKIVCDNCAAKYSIADEKVAGKVFKIRCKKCSNVIKVRGDQVDGQAVQEQGQAAFDYGGEAVWHVVVNGDQQGPFSPAQLGQMLTEGTIDWEAYVWREGFDGWKPARDLPDLVAAITGEPAPGAQEAAPVAAAAAAADPFGGAAAADPFGGDAGAAADPFASAGGADPFGGGGGGGADLFAEGGGGYGEEDVVASQPSPRVSEAQAMTGARNENSVLFSLSNLQALATGGNDAGAPATSSAPAGHATGEGSGLIDIRALASATGTTSGPAAAGTSNAGPNDDLLSIGGAPAGLGGGGLGAPVLAPVAAEPEEKSKGMLIGLIAAAVMVIALLGVLIFVLMKDDPAPVVAANTNAAAPAAAAGAAPAVPAPAIEAAAPATPAAAAPAAAAPAEPAGEEAAAEEEAPGQSGDSVMRRRRRRGGSSGGGDAPAAAAAPAPTSAPMSSPMRSGSLDDLLDSAIGGGGGSMMATAMMAASNLPDQPSRDSVRRALQGVSPRAARCGNGTSGVANSAIVFANSGRVRSVRVSGVSPAIQSCVSRAVRAARVPPFSRSTFNVNFPFRVQ